jgi:3-methylcrotonyl-CoA carboxylase alpha subunit
MPGAGIQLEFDGQRRARRAFQPGGQLRVDLGGAASRHRGRRQRKAPRLHRRRLHVFAAIDPLFHAGSGGGAEGGLTAPMPGKVIALIARPARGWRRARRC